MKENSGSGAIELKRALMERLSGLGIDAELVKIDVRQGPEVILSGEICSERERGMILQCVCDSVGEDAVTDGLIVIEGLYSDDDGFEDRDGDFSVYDEDEDVMGTEDLYRALEDGIPYVPPTEDPLEPGQDDW